MEPDASTTKMMSATVAHAMETVDNIIVTRVRS